MLFRGGDESPFVCCDGFAILRRPLKHAARRTPTPLALFFSKTRN